MFNQFGMESFFFSFLFLLATPRFINSRAEALPYFGIQRVDLVGFALFSATNQCFIQLSAFSTFFFFRLDSQIVSNPSQWTPVPCPEFWPKPASNPQNPALKPSFKAA